MKANFLGLIAIALSIGAFALTYAYLRHRTTSVRGVLFVALSLLAIPSALFTVYYLHVLPDHAWFYNLRSCPGSELLVIFLGCAAGTVASLLPRVLLVLPLCALIVLAAVPYAKPLLWPINDSDFTESWAGDICLQSTPCTCGPASISTILRRLKVDTSEREAAHAAFSSATGTEAWYLARYVRRKGLVARFDFARTFSPSTELPAVVGVRLGSAGHFIAVLDVSEGQVTFADPLIGEGHLSVSQFQKRYDLTGFRMVITKARP